MPAETDYQQYYAPDRADWRMWLEANHATSPGVWLVWCGLQILRRQCRQPDGDIGAWAGSPLAGQESV